MTWSRQGKQIFTSTHTNIFGIWETESPRWLFFFFFLWCDVPSFKLNVTQDWNIHPNPLHWGRVRSNKDDFYMVADFPRITGMSHFCNPVICLFAFSANTSTSITSNFISRCSSNFSVVIPSERSQVQHPILNSAVSDAFTLLAYTQLRAYFLRSLQISPLSHVAVSVQLNTLFSKVPL